jgi:hypothetical protein
MKKLLSTITITGSLAMLLFGFIPQEAGALTMEYKPVGSVPTVDIGSLRWYDNPNRWPNGNACIYIKDVDNKLSDCGVEGWLCDADGKLATNCPYVDPCDKYLFHAASYPVRLRNVDPSLCPDEIVRMSLSIKRYFKISLWGMTFKIPTTDYSVKAPYASIDLLVIQRDRDTGDWSKLKIEIYNIELKLTRTW